MRVSDFVCCTTETIVFVIHGRECITLTEEEKRNYLVTNFHIDYERKCVIANITHIATLIR